MTRTTTWPASLHIRIGLRNRTYMLDGRMRHEDHLGNRGDLVPATYSDDARRHNPLRDAQQSEAACAAFSIGSIFHRRKNETRAYRDIPRARSRG